jgi:hypothetical protein
LPSFRYSTLQSTQTKIDTEHTTHNNQQDEPCHPTPSGFALSLSMGRAAAPPNHGAAAPQRHTQAASCRACTRCRWFAHLGGQNERIKHALALGGRHFINYTQQSNKRRHRQWRGSWGGHANGAEPVGERRIVALVVELINEN